MQVEARELGDRELKRIQRFLRALLYLAPISPKRPKAYLSIPLKFQSNWKHPHKVCDADRCSSTCFRIAALQRQRNSRAPVGITVPPLALLKVTAAFQIFFADYETILTNPRTLPKDDRNDKLVPKERTVC